MTDQEGEDKSDSGWWMPCLAALLAFAIGVAIAATRAFDLLEIAYLFVLAPVATLLFAGVTLLYARRARKPLSRWLLLAFPVYWAVTLALFANLTFVHLHTRWLLAANKYKAALLAQPRRSSEGLNHMEWDGWGWAGMDTNVQLVFDPSNSLAANAKDRTSGRISGIPCSVYRVYRLEDRWYAVQFYTNNDRAACG